MIIQEFTPKLIICMDLTAEPYKKAKTCLVKFIQDILLVRYSFKGLIIKLKDLSETHDAAASLKEKLRCLICIRVIHTPPELSKN